jgi:hypothetical protein
MMQSVAKKCQGLKQGRETVNDHRVVAPQYRRCFHVARFRHLPCNGGTGYKIEAAVSCFSRKFFLAEHAVTDVTFS